MHMPDQRKIISCRTLDEPPALAPFRIPEKDFGNGLVVRSSNWLGDAVMTFPALRQLRTILPENCGLFVLTPAPLAPLYHALNTLVDRVLPLAGAHSFPSRAEKNALKSLHAGAGVLFNNSFRDALILKRSGVKHLFGAKARFRSFLLSASWSFPPRRDRELNHPHQASKYLAMAYALGAEKWDNVMPEITPHAVPEHRRDNLFSLLENTEILALAPGAAYGDAKRWNSSSFRRAGEWWLEHHPRGILFALGSSSERSGAEEALAGLPPDRTFNFAGKTSLDELMVILKRVKCCLANDSGIMHLSAALGGHGIAVFGSTDPAATSPVSPSGSWRILYEKIPCAPCFKRICPLKTKACLAKITPDDVIACLEQETAC